MIARLAAILALVLLNAFFVCAEFALVRARRSRLEAMARGGDPLAAQALRALGASRQMLSATQLGSTLATLGLGWLMAEWAVELPLVAAGPLGIIIRATIAVAAVAYLHIVFSELVPKAAALSQPEWLARVTAAPLLAFSRLTRPFTALLSWSAHLVTRRVREGASAEAAVVPLTEELRVLVERSRETGEMPAQEATLLGGVLDFTGLSVRAVMTPRTEIVALPVLATLDDAASVIEESGFSRFPVYAESVDNIVGILLAKDLISLLRAKPPDTSTVGASDPIGRILRPVHFVPSARAVAEVLADFKRLKEHMVVVLDEHGGTAGLVTVHDLIEEIVGPIPDEHDEAEAPIPAARAGETLVPGGTSITELNEHLGLAVPEHDFATIGGFVFGALGRVPRVGDQLAAGGAVFTVRAVEGRRAETLAVKLKEVGSRE
ncbi:MAG: hemolysin family protein [Gemmatimonadota bacterium]|nr:hemolysin family protein [Gemmatimonadota bacterium]